MEMRIGEKGIVPPSSKPTHNTANQENPVAEKILREAILELVKIVSALDNLDALPIALCGSLAKPLEKYLPTSILRRLVTPQGDSVTGALWLIKNRLSK